MKLQDQVCTLEQAKQLKAFGIYQYCLFAYVGTNEVELKNNNIVYTDGYDWHDHPGYAAYPFQYSAFTAAELGEMLKGFNLPIYWKLWAEWCYKEGDQPVGYGNEAVARASMLIYLLKQNIITTAEVNQRLKQ